MKNISERDLVVVMLFTIGAFISMCGVITQIGRKSIKPLLKGGQGLDWRG